MHTVIINTLGAAYVKKDIYFLAYDPEQILWLETEPDQIRKCVDLIRDYHSQRIVREDYRLVILADLDPYANSEFKDQRDKLKKLLRYWYIKELLRPLEEAFLLPEDVTELFLSTKSKDNATSPVKYYHDLFDIHHVDSRISITLPYEEANGQQVRKLDYTPHLGTLVAEIAEATSSFPVATAVSEVTVPSPRRGLQPIGPNAFDISVPVTSEQPHNTPETLTADHIEQEIDSNQNYSLVRKFGNQLSIQQIPFETKLTNPAAIFADMQIAIAKLIGLYENAEGRSVGSTEIDPSQLKPHTQEELGKLLANAEANLLKMRSADTQKRLYYPLKTDAMVNDTPSGLYVKMTERLKKEVSDVPGVSDALLKTNAAENNSSMEDSATQDEDPNTLTGLVKKKLRFGWLQLRRITGNFYSTYATLQAEYDPETVYADQQKIISVCAEEYTSWRTEQRQGELRPKKDAPTLTTRPQLSDGPFEELVTARSGCAKGVLEQLHDFTDVRKEAAELHTEFRALTRFWSPHNSSKGATYFRRFSLIIGILFVVCAILPFFLISSQSNDFEISRVVVFVLTTLAFALLYAIGVIIWLNNLADKLADLEYQLCRLLDESKKLRAESVRSLLNVYASELPACLLKQKHYDYMVSVDRINEEATRKYEEHMYIMDQALDEIGDIRTALHLKHQTGEARKNTQLDFSLPPYAPANRKFYMLFEGGNV